MHVNPLLYGTFWDKNLKIGKQLVYLFPTISMSDCSEMRLLDWYIDLNKGKCEMEKLTRFKKKVKKHLNVLSYCSVRIVYTK